MAGLFTPSHSQIYKYVRLEDGLSSRNVYAVQQSNGGFMWFLTDNGIDRYDGTNISNYTVKVGGHQFTEYSTSRFVYDKLEDNLWLVTNLGRVIHYNKRINAFEVVFFPQITADNSDIFESAVSPIDQQGNIWIFIKNEAFCYNVRTLEGRSIQLDTPRDSVTYSAIVSRDDSTLFIGGKGGMYTGSIKGDSISIRPMEELQSRLIDANTLYYHSPSQTLLIGSEDKGIYAYKEQTKEVIHYENILTDVRVTKIIPFNNENEVLFSTNAACIYRMGINDCIPSPYLQADFTTNYRINTDNIADICIDKDGQLWMCSFPHGLTIRNDAYPKFNWVKRSLIKSNTLNNNSVDCIIEDSDYDLWYATDNGISLYTPRSNEWHTMLSIADKSTNMNHYFLTICEIKPGIILAGGYAAGVYLIDKKSKQVRFIKPDLMSPEKYIQTMFFDKTDQTVWMGGENQLINISYHNDKLKVNYAEAFRGINYITQKDENTLWIGTKNGLYIFDKKTHEKQQVILPLERFKVNTIFHDNDGTIYIGTHHHGLIVYNEKENYYNRFSKKNSALTNDCMKCILGANNGSLFISSDGGIVRYNKNTGKITTWTNDQGLQNINFSIRAGVHTHNQTIMFGGDNGVIEISENVDLPHIYKSKLVLADLYIGNTRITPSEEGSPLTNAIDDMAKIELSHNQREASIKVRSINHIYPSDCLITWTFDQKKSNWNPLNEDKFIMLNNLSAGKHILTIRSTSNESGKILDERTLEIKIHPPFYLSRTGLFIELTIVILIVLIIGRYIKSANEKHISNEKLNFFINTAHDIRTPLTLIKAPLEELMGKEHLSEEDKETLSLAIKNTNMLTEMTEKSMRYEIANIEKGILRIECYEAIELFSAQIERLKSLTKPKRQQIDYTYPNQPFQIWIDKQKINSIFQNLFSNAVKYSGIEQIITVTLYCDNKRWGFKVSDNGIGISDEEKQKLFKGVFRGRNAINAHISGSGIGLLSISHYIQQLGGKIHVTSKINEGSTFDVSFPLGKEHYNPATTKFIDRTSNFISETETFADATINSDNRERLLIVEDNPDLLEYLSRHFSKKYRVFTANNGKEALDKIPYVQPLIVLTDVMMPEMRGDDLCTAIKNDISTSHIAVVLISALSDQQSIINGLTVKADAYITKPFDFRILDITIQNLIENRQLLKHRLTTLDIDDNINATSEIDLKFMNELKQIVEKNLDCHEFTVDTLAYELRVSRTSLYNKVKALTDNTPSDFIRLCRINKAKHLLREGYGVTEVADKVGFSDQKYFREVFKKIVGMPPSEYAKTKEQDNIRPA